MDFHGLKRKELQKLCKKHGVPANLTNREMADRLASIYKEKEEPISSAKLNTDPEAIGGENEAKVVKKQAKKVRFSPENQTIEYEVSVYQQPRRRSRKQVLFRNPAQTFKNAPKSEDIRKVEDGQVRVTRSRVQNAVEDDENMVFSPPVGGKRRRGGMKDRDAEVDQIGKPEVLEVGEREYVKNGNDKVTGGLNGRQLRSRKNVIQEESKIRKGEGGDEVHLFVKIPEASDVGEDTKSKIGRNQPRRTARNEDQPVKMSSEVEKVEVVSRVTRQSRTQPKHIASMVESEVKTAGVRGGCDEVLQLEPQKGRGRNSLSLNVLPQAVCAKSSLIAIGAAAAAAAAEKLLRRSKRNAVGDSAKNATSVRSETQLTEVRDQSERSIALEKPSEFLRRHSSGRKSQSGKGGNKEEFLKKETKKRTAELEEDEIERAKTSFSLQDQAPWRRSRRNTLILNPPSLTDAELANKEDFNNMQRLEAPYLGKDVTEELPRKSSQNSFGCSLSGTSKEEQIAVAKKDQGVKQQMQESGLEEEKTSVVEHHPVTEKPERRSNRITSIRASVAPCNAIAKVVKKRRPSKSRMETREEATLTKSLPAPGQSPDRSGELVVAEGSVNKNDHSCVKDVDGCSNKKRKGLRGNSGAKKQCAFLEASPLVLDMGESKDSAGNTEETLITTTEKLVDLSADQEMQLSARESIVVEEKGNNLLGDDRERFVHGGNVESESNCRSIQSANTTFVLDEAKCPDPKFLARAEITVNIAERGICDQEMMEDMKPIDSNSAHESFVVYREDRSLTKNDKRSFTQVDSNDNEMNHPQNETGAVDGSNLLEPRQVEFECKVIKIDLSEITSISNGHSLADQRDFTGATSTLLNSQKELETEPPRGENTNLMSDNVNADDRKIPFGEAQISVELKDTSVEAAESHGEEIFKDPPNEFSETSGMKSESGNTLKQVEEIIACDFSNRDGIRHMESSAKPTKNQETSNEVEFATAETGAQKIIEIQHSSYSNIASLEAPCGPASASQSKDETWRVEATDTAGRVISDNERIEDLNPTNAQFIHESVLVCGENTGVVKNDEEIRIHDDTFDGEMKHQSCLLLNITVAVADSNLIEPRMVDLETNSSKMVSPEITSLANNVHSSASQADLAVKTSQRELEQVLETGEASENINSIYCNMDAERSRTPIEEDQIKPQLKDANLTAANSIGEVIFNDLLNELGGSIDLKRGSETPLKKPKKQIATDFSDVEGFAHTESSVKAIEKHGCRAQIDIFTAITGTPKITDMKRSSSSDTAIYEEALFGSAPECQDKLCCAGITTSISGSAVCNHDEETSLVEDDKEILIQDDTIEVEKKYRPCLSLNKTSALDDALVEPGMVEPESNANKVICSEMTSLADVCSSASQTKFSNETSNALKPEKVLESVESPRSKTVNYKSDKTEVEDDKIPAQEYQNSMQLEDAYTISAESVQEIVSRVQLNEPCESYGTKELKFSLKEAEETSTDDFSRKEMVETESLVDIDENSEATAKVHALTAETGENTIMEMCWNLSSEGTIYRVELENALSNEEYEMCAHQKDEANVKIVETEHDETINTAKELFFSGREILEESFEGKLLVGGVCHQLSDSTDGQSAEGISEESFNNVSCETEGKHVCEVLAEEGTGLVSSEEKDNDVSESVSHADVSPQFICNEKLPINSCLPVSNDMQEQPEAVCSDNNLRNEIQACVLLQLAVEQLSGESDAAKQGAENGGANARAISNATQALPSEELTAPIISEPFSTRPHYHALVDGESNSSCERVTDYPYSKDFAATMDSSGISASRETYVGEDDGTVVEQAKSLELGLADHSCWNVVSNEFSEEMPNAYVGTRLPFVKANYGDLDDQGEDIALQHDCSSSIELVGPKSTVGIIVDNMSKVGTLDSTLNNNDHRSEIKVEDFDGNDSNAANEINAAFNVEEAGHKDGRKTPVSHQRSLHGGKKEDVPSYADKPCGKPEISIEKELHSQVKDDVNDVGTEISIDCEVTRGKRDGCEISTQFGGFSGVTDGVLVERSEGDLEEISEARSDDHEGSVKTATFMDSTNSLVVNRPLCLDGSKSSEPETEEPQGLHLPSKLAGESREVGSCNKPEMVASMKHEMVVDCYSITSISAAPDENKDLQNPDESHMLINMEMSLFSGGEDKVKKADASAGDSNHHALDNTINECNSSYLKEEDYVKDINFSVKKEGPEEIKEDKGPLLKNSEIVVEREEALRTELEFLSSQKKNVKAKKQGENSVFTKQLTSSPINILKSKSKSSSVQRTPKRLIIHDVKENEGGTNKRDEIGNRTTPKTSSRTRRPPLRPVWK